MSVSLESKKDILDIYRKRISESHVLKLERLGVAFVEDRREGSKVFDIDGKEYIDCFCSGGQFVLGHRRPEMLAALSAAIKELDLGNFVMISAQKGALAKLLAEISPGELKCAVFGVSRGESNDFAMKLARGATGRKQIISFVGARHGQTGFALSASDDKQRANLFGPLIPQIKYIPLDVESLRKNVTDKTAAVIVEPVQSDAGVVSPPQGFLAEARRICDRRGAVLIFDEGQTGFGRTGKLFACGHSSVTPDILTVSKAMGGTVYPITATIFTSKLNRFMLTHPLIHLSTFGGADVGCVVAMAAIDLIRKEKLWENSKSAGQQLLDGLKGIAKDNPRYFKEARGTGLLVGLEAFNASTAEVFSRQLAYGGVIAMPAPANPAVVRFTPPIDISKKEIDVILDAAEKAAKSIA